MMTMRNFLRGAAVLSSLGLAGLFVAHQSGCFSGEKHDVVSNSESSAAGASKPTLMSGSKSYSGPTVVGARPTPASTTQRMLMSGSKSAGTIMVDGTGGTTTGTTVGQGTVRVVPQGVNPEGNVGAVDPAAQQAVNRAAEKVSKQQAARQANQQAAPQR